jgi:hypothetical protein
MKAALTFLVLALSALAQEERPVPGSLEGIVFDFRTGSPMVNTPMNLSSTQRPAGRGNRGAQLATPDFATTTDSAGKFSFKNIGPGEYRLVPGAGYGYAGRQRDFPTTSTVFTFSSGQQIRGLRLPVVPLSIVSGRILDQNDQPQPSVPVELYELVYSVSGEKYLGTSRGSTVTDQSGRYRIVDIEPGELYLVARKEVGQPLFPITYYPGAVDPENATPIRVSGTEVGGIDIRLGGTDLHTIRVKVPRPAGVTPELMALFTVSTQSRGRFLTALMIPRTIVPQFLALGNDTYASPPLPPDNYIIDVTWRSPTGGPSGAALMAARWRYPKARFLVHLEDKNVDAGTIVNWSTPTSISGRMFANGLTEPDFPQYNISLVSAEPAADSVRLAFAADGTFNLPELVPGRYSVRAQALPGGLHLVSARFAGREVVDMIFTIEQNSSGPLEFTIAPGAGSIDGSVATIKDEPVTFGRVVLVPSLNRRGNPNLFVSVFTDQTGAYSFKTVPPGDYTLIAWDWVRLYSYLNPAVLSEVEGRGKKITVAPGSQNRVTLQAIAGSR